MINNNKANIEWGEWERQGQLEGEYGKESVRKTEWDRQNIWKVLCNMFNARLIGYRIIDLYCAAEIENKPRPTTVAAARETKKKRIINKQRQRVIWLHKINGFPDIYLHRQLKHKLNNLSSIKPFANGE